MPALKDAIGEKAFEELEGIILEKIRTHSVSRDEFREVLSRLDLIEHDVADLKVEVRELRREMNERFDRLYKEMNERFDRLYKEMNERFDRMNERFDKMNERFDRMNERFDQMYERMTSLMKWTVGTLALFGSIISILLAIGQFIK